LLAALLADPYFAKPPPKSTGPEYFSMQWLERQLAAAGPADKADVQATLLALTAQSIADAIGSFPGLARPDVFVCGGGAHNGALMHALQRHLPGCAVGRTDELGVSVDWVEAMAFAWLAYRRLQGLPGNCPRVTGASRPAILGSLILPS
jgi:anhydro-N-acetylmuramic acid kinase